MLKSLARPTPFMEKGHLAQGHPKLDAPFRQWRSQPRRRPRTVRPRSTEHVDAIRALLANDPYLSQKRLLSF
jgi:hypothetical protein